MQIGIDSFAAAHDDASLAVSPSDRLRNLLAQIERVGWHLSADFSNERRLYTSCEDDSSH
jgi:hypothetical protein